MTRLLSPGAIRSTIAMLAAWAAAALLVPLVASGQPHAGTAAEVGDNAVAEPSSIGEDYLMRFRGGARLFPDSPA